MIPEPSIYTGTLRHRRFRPVPHEFSYRVFMALLDVDRIPETMARSRVSSYGGFNWAAFRESDHFGDPARPLRARLEADATAHGVTLPSGPVFLLTNLRYLGYCFNPISLYYFFDAAGDVPVALAEVNSTFGESRNYWLSRANRTAEKALRFRCAKTMHVSPFMAMNLDYDFALTPPDDRLVAHMNTIEAGDRFFDATLTLDRQPWTASNLRRALLAQPWITAKVIGAIHWQALRLWWKGAPVFTHPDRIQKPIGKVAKPL